MVKENKDYLKRVQEREQPRTEVRPKGYGPAKAGSGGGKSVDMFNPRKPKKPLMSTGGFVAQ